MLKIGSMVSILDERSFSMNAFVSCLNACLGYVDNNLQPDEAIIQIEHGQTQFGHDAQLIYLVRIATCLEIRQLIHDTAW
jgi:hypothetical protein